jgi:hypothetical protein
MNAQGVGLELTVRCDICRREFKTVLTPGDMATMFAALPEGTSEVATVCPDCRGNLNAALFYEADAGDRVRIAIRYGGVWRHIFWVRASRDGDLYCTFGYGEFIASAATAATVASEGQVEVKYGQGEAEVTGPLKGGRVSFHASGQINLGDRHLAGTPLRNRTAQEFLCALAFEHPSVFPPLGAVGNRDILLPFETAEDRALVAAVHVTPPGVDVRLDTGFRELGEPRRHIVITYKNLQVPGVDHLAVQVVVGLGPHVDAWPPKSYVLVPGGAADG